MEVQIQDVGRADSFQRLEGDPIPGMSPSGCWLPAVLGLWLLPSDFCSLLETPILSVSLCSLSLLSGLISGSFMIHTCRDRICNHTVTSEVLGGRDFWGMLFEALNRWPSRHSVLQLPLLQVSATPQGLLGLFPVPDVNPFWKDWEAEGVSCNDEGLRRDGILHRARFLQRTPLRKDSEEILAWPGDGMRRSERVRL